MGSVVVYSKAKVDALTNNVFTGGSVDGSGHLIMVQQDGGTVDVGDVGKDHGALTGLADDDHTQYAKADGSRGDFATEAQGVKADEARVNVGAEITFTGDNADGVLETIIIVDDSSDTTTWPDRLVFKFDPTDDTPRNTFYLNEYGEMRCSPAKHNTTAVRVFTKETPTDPTTARDLEAPVIELMDNRTDRNSLWAIHSNGITRVAEIPMAYVLVLDELDSVPAGTPVGTVIVRTA